MTSPQPQYTQPTQGFTPAEQTAVAALTTALAEAGTVGAVALPPYVMAELLEAGFRRSAVYAAIRLGTKGTPRFAAPRVLSAASQTANTELGMRARYILAAAKRITSALGNGTNLFDAIHVERGFLAQHVDAQRNRAQAARAVDTLAQGHTWLQWRTMRDHRVSPDCAALEGQLFTVDQPLTDVLGKPVWPGSAHPSCRCVPAPAFETPFGEQPTVTTQQ